MSDQAVVLVVDDDNAIREVVSMALAAEGYEVVAAPHGAAALDLLGQSRPNVILLDMRMPVMDGWEFARAYRQLPGPRAPMIAFTAVRDVAERAAEIGADAFLGKPFELNELFGLVERYARP